jgi:peptidyl-prolyl cis-trans isomerase A (cyclophilin A)
MFPAEQCSTRRELLRWALLFALCLGCRHGRLEPPSVAEALAGFPEGQPIAVTLETTEGPVHCELDASRAPHAVALFVGLATGRAAWLDPKTREVTRRPLYDNLTFHRAIPHVLVQSGCPVGDSSGHPGYRIAVEASPDDAARLARPGALLLARYTPAPGRADPDPPPPGHVLGSQFVVALTDMSHLASQVSVLGRCRDLETVDRIAERATSGKDRPRLLSIGMP